MADQLPAFEPCWFGDYELLRLIGVGGMAEVFLARTRGAHDFRKLVVVKRILPRLRDDQRFISMFVAEAKNAVQLQHANIVQVLSLEEQEAWPFIVMEYVHGKDLHQVVRAARKEQVELPVDFVIHCLVEILKGLGHAHRLTSHGGRSHQLLHRDVTPENIFVAYSGDVKLGDFGVAHAVGERGTRELRGKIGYVAPEILEDLPVDQRSDLYSAGVVLWEALTRRKLYRGSSPAEILAQARAGRPPRASAHNPRVPPDLDAIIAKALAKERTERYQSAQEFEDALSDFLYARNLRWNRRRIAAVMEARHPEGLAQPELPPVLSVPSLSMRPGGDDVAYDDISAKHVADALGEVLRPTLSVPPGFEPAPGTVPDPSDAGIGGGDHPAASAPSVYSEESPTERLLLFQRDDPTPLPCPFDAALERLARVPEEFPAIGVPGRSPLLREDFGRLCLWDSLAGVPIPTPPPRVEERFTNVSLVRLLYEMAMRRMTGLLLLEDAAGAQRRLLSLREGLPLYVYSSRADDGLPVSLMRHDLLERQLIYRGLVQVVCERRPLELALVDVMRQEEDPTPRLQRYVSTLTLRRLYPAFTWSDGRFFAYTTPPSDPPCVWPLPSLLGILVHAVRNTCTLDRLQVVLRGKGLHAVVPSLKRERHTQALRLRGPDLELLQAIDGQCNLPQLLSRIVAPAPDGLHRALAVIYVLAETHLIELI